MIDRDNVIKGLKDIVDFFEVMSVIENRCNELKQEAEDALILLKGQEPIEPEKDIALNKRCPKCYAILKGKYCHNCGQAVKWK